MTEIFFLKTCDLRNLGKGDRCIVMLFLCILKQVLNAQNFLTSFFELGGFHFPRKTVVEQIKHFKKKTVKPQQSTFWLNFIYNSHFLNDID